MMERVEVLYEPLFRANVTADFASPTSDLASYRLVIVPNLYLVSDEAADNLRAYVESGGTLVMSFFSGIVDPSDHVRLGGYPGAFAEVLGLRVEDFEPLAEGERVGLRFADGERARGRTWSELITPLGAEVIAAFEGGSLDGRPAVLRHELGRGAAWYLGTAPGRLATERILRRAWTEAGVTPAAEAPEGVEAVRRVTGSGGLLFLLNHGPGEVEVSVPSGGMELITGRPLTADRLVLGPREVAIVREPPAENPPAA
jgi:beta-galactosidase